MTPAPRFHFGPFDLDVSTFKLLRDGRPVPLEPKALDLLTVLIERAPRVVDKGEIFSLVWRDVAVTDNALTRVVAHLRKVLEDDPKAPRYIETIATRGYRFLADVNREVNVGAGHVAVDRSSSEVPQSPLGARSGSRRHGALWRGATVTLAMAAFAMMWLGYTRLNTASATGARAADDLVFARLRPRQVTIGAGFDGFAAFAPDGKSIAYSSDRTGALEIYVQGLAPGATASALTTDGRQNVQPAWSPDGQFLAYHEMAGNGIWIVPARGGAARKVSTFGAHPAWSPDGRYIAFQSLPVVDINPLRAPGALSTIWVVEAGGRGQPVRLTVPGDPPGPHLSPVWWKDSILFAAPTTSSTVRQTRLWRMRVRTRALLSVSSHDTLSADFTLAPDGRGVLFVAGGTNAVWFLPLDDNGSASAEPRPTGLAAAGSMITDLALSPDGRHLAWTVIDSSSHIWQAPLHRGNRRSPETRALTEGSGLHYSVPVPSTGGRVAFVGRRHGMGAAIYLLGPDGAPVQLTADASSHSGPHWMPGERELAVVSDHGEGPGLWAVDATTRRERALFPLDALSLPPGGRLSAAALAANVALAPDFSRLAMSIVKGGVPNLWLAPLRDARPAGTLVQRTAEREAGTYPQWSPDGQWIAYQCATGADTHVCIIRADAGDRVQLTSAPGQSWIGGWSPDTSEVIFAARRDGIWNVAAVSRLTSTVRSLTAFDDPTIYVRYPRWDQAASRVVFERSDTKGRVWAVEIP